MLETEVSEQIDEDKYKSLKKAVELGKWRNGERLNKQQLEAVLRLVMLYESKNGIDPLQVLDGINCPGKNQ